MESLIRFRALYDSLTLPEQNVFLTKFIESFGIQLIITAVFNHFAQSILNSKPYNDHQIQSMNKIISNIIHSRPAKKTVDNPPISSNINLKIDELPPPLISNISSFLSQNKYINFQKSNRRVYVGCNSVFSLQNSDVSSTIRTYPCSQLFQPLRLKTFSLTQSIKAHCEHFTNAIYPNIHKQPFRHLKKLSLYHGDQPTIKSFLELQHDEAQCHDVFFKNIQHLELIRFQKLFNDQCQVCTYVDPGSIRYDIMQNIEATVFIKFLSLFPNIKYIDLSYIYLEFDINWTTEDIPILPKLKGLRVELGANHWYADNTKELCIRLIDKNIERIQSLYCDAWLLSAPTITNPFKNLKEFKSTCFNKDILQITEHTNQLRMVSLGYVSTYNGPSIIYDHLQEFVKKLLKSQPYLKYLEIDISNMGDETWKRNLEETWRKYGR